MPAIENERSSSEELVITRTFDAPRALVWKVWTEREHLMHWWGPKGLTMVSAKVDLRPGGIFHYGMKAANGDEMWGKFVYREISEPDRLVFVVSFSDPDTNTVRAPFSETWPLEVQSTLTLVEEGGKTTVTMRAIPVNANEEEWRSFAAMHVSMRGGWGGTLDQLEAYLGSQR
ncbi:MAG TPA: SRPBCC domain-containing protein [Thermoanaerobaculia bacterium]|nr:SRPBCC domain-containing protein [Thermoanaerobaculia bacterium]